jgi:hypothetical protein
MITHYQKMTPTRRAREGNRKPETDTKNKTKAKKDRMEREQREKKTKLLSGASAVGKAGRDWYGLETGRTGPSRATALGNSRKSCMDADRRVSLLFAVTGPFQWILPNGIENHLTISSSEKAPPDHLQFNYAKG